MKPATLTIQQQRFVAEYLTDLNATQAAVRAGYSKRTARSQGQRLLTNVDISAAVAAGANRVLGALELDTKNTLEQLRRIVFMDIRTLFDAHGNLREIAELTEAEAIAIAGTEVIIKNAAAGDGVTDTVHKIKLVDRLKAIELAMQYLHLLDQPVAVVNASVNIVQILRSRYERRLRLVPGPDSVVPR